MFRRRLPSAGSPGPMPLENGCDGGTGHEINYISVAVIL
jgi:hypothetical protein